MMIYPETDRVYFMFSLGREKKMEYIGYRIDKGTCVGDIKIKKKKLKLKRKKDGESVQLCWRENREQGGLANDE